MNGKITLGKMKQIKDPRTIWSNEATEFTPWLAANIDELSSELGLSLEVVETESAVGDFSLDILAQDSNTENYAVIENQLEETNHDHLGKLLTYAAGKNAKHIIWVVKKARDEHRAAIQWLNNNTGDDVGFFLVEVQAWTVNGSIPAPNFFVIEQPNGWAKHIKRAGREAGIATQQVKFDFWTEFKDYAFHDSTFAAEFKEHAAAATRVYSLGIGFSDVCLHLTVNTMTNVVGVELHVADNKPLYDELYSCKDDIEATVGEKLSWNRCDENKSSRVRSEYRANLRDAEERKDCFDWLMAYALSFKAAFKDILADIT